MYLQKRCRFVVATVETVVDFESEDQEFGLASELNS